MVKITTRIDLNFPEFILKDNLQEIADEIIIKDIKQRIVEEVNLSDQHYRPLAESTKRAKARQGLRPEILQATTLLIQSFRSEPFGQGIRIFVDDIRTRVAEILQLEGVVSKQFGGKRRFEFFGISKRAELKSIAFMVKKVNEAISRGKRRTI